MTFPFLKKIVSLGMILCLAVPAAVSAQDNDADVMRVIDLRKKNSDVEPGVLDPSLILSEEIGPSEPIQFGAKIPVAGIPKPIGSSMIQSEPGSKPVPAFQTSTRTQHAKQHTTQSQNGDAKKIQVRPELTPRKRAVDNASDPPPPTDQATFKSLSAPAVQTQIIAPRFINVNQTAQLQLQVENVGNVDISDVKLTAILPQHARFVSSTPQPTQTNGNEYEFVVTNLAAHKRQFIRLDVIPTTKMPLDISTSVQIVSTQHVAVKVQQPILDVQVDGPSLVQTGQTFKNIIRVKNVGDGYAEKILLHPSRPEAIVESTPPQRVYLEKLGPGQEVHFEVFSFARDIGNVEMGFEVTAEGAESRSINKTIDIQQPELQVLAVGPNKNFINHDGIYTIQLENTSQVNINDVRVELFIPEGLHINTISRQASVDQKKGMLVWTFNQFADSQRELIQFRASAVEEGNQVCRIVVHTKEMPAKEFKLTTEVASRADVNISLSDAGGPVGIGNKMEFIVELKNQGGRDSNQAQVIVDLPPGLTPEGQQGYLINDSQNQILFQNIMIPANHTVTLRFTCVAVAQGDHIVRGTLQLEGSTQGISAEDSVFVFESAETKVSDALTPVIHR